MANFMQLSGVGGRSVFRRVIEAIWPPPVQQGHPSPWRDHLSRHVRYEINWSFYDQTIYMGRFGQAVRREFRLTKDVRPVYSAVARIVDFHATHVHGGTLDADAGDGTVTPTCLPFVIGASAPDNLRPVIAKVLLSSNYAVTKTLLARWGACLGDVGMEAIPDPRRQTVRIRIVHPSEIEDVTRDAYGNVRGYRLCRWEVDPDDPSGDSYAKYKEVVTNKNGVVTYKTFREDQAYAWPDSPGMEWESRWGFVPMVLIKHIDNGSPYGIAEIQGAFFKTMEADDQGSNLSNQILKTTNGPWFLKGASLPIPVPGGYPMGSAPCMPGSPGYGTPGVLNSMWGRRNDDSLDQNTKQDIKFITSQSKDSDVKPLVYPLQIADADGHIRSIIDSLVMDYPELQADLDTHSGDRASGTAIERGRDKATAKIQERRGAYDAALVAVLKMAMTMGGDEGFAGFEGMGSGAFEGGLLDFSIGTRPVFASSEADKDEQRARRAGTTKIYVDAKINLSDALRLAGFSEKEAGEIAARTTPAPVPPPAPAVPGASAALLRPSEVPPAPPGITTPYSPSLSSDYAGSGASLRV